MSGKVSMCLLNPSLVLNKQRPIHRAPQPRVNAGQKQEVNAAQKSVDNDKSALKKETRNKMNIAGLRNAKPCGRCGGAR